VETASEWGMQYVMQRVIKPSGHYTFRVWFGNSSEQTIQPQVLKEINVIGCLMEYYSTNLLGVDATSDSQAQEVANLLFRHQQLGHLVYETGRTQ
jgi:hypothetical protein